MIFEDEQELIAQGTIIHSNIREAGILVKTSQGLAIKCFSSKGLILDFFRNIFGQTKAHKQWKSAQRLLQLGLKTPKPIAVKKLKPGRTYEAAYLYAYKEDALPFHEAIHCRDSLELLKKLADELSHLAKNNALFIDFHLGNILVDPANNLWWIDPEIKISRSYTKDRFWKRMNRMHTKCDPGVLDQAQWEYFTQQLNQSLPSWLTNEC